MAHPGKDRPRTAGPAARDAGRPNTVAMVVQSLEGGGLQRVVLDISKGLLERGCKVEIIVLPRGPFSSHGPPAELALPAGVGIWRTYPKWTRTLDLALHLLRGEAGMAGRLPRWHPRRALHGIAWRWSRRMERASVRARMQSFAGRRFWQKIARLAPHAVIVHGREAMLYVSRILGSVRESPPIAVVLHDSRLKKMLDEIVRELAEIRTPRAASPRWAVVNPRVARAASSILGIDEDEIIDLTNGCDTARVARMAREAEPAADADTVLWVGEHSPRKRGGDAIAAFAAARARRPMRLLMLGEGRERARLRALADATGFGADILMPGFAGNPYADMAACGAFLHTAESEGLALVLIEALSLGTFCVSTDCPYGPGDILNDPRLGRLVPVGDIGGLAEAMLAALDRRRTENREDREFRMRNVRERFRMEAAVDRYDRLVGGLRRGFPPERAAGPQSAVP